MKLHPPELTRIVEDERSLALEQHKVVVFAWTKLRSLSEKFAGHPKMHPYPAGGRELEEQLFTPSMGTGQHRPRQLPLQRTDRDAPEDSFVRVQLHRDDFLRETVVPALTVIFDLSQFGHVLTLRDGAAR